jgi:hypothetical protein
MLVTVKLSIGNIMGFQIKRIGKQNYKYEVVWDEKEKKQRWRYIGKVTNDVEPIGKLSDPGLISKLKYIFYATLIISFITGFLFQPHSYFWWDEHPAFHALYGFVFCVIIVLGAKSLEHYIKREVNYYD